MRIKVLILNGSTPATIQALTVLDPLKYEAHVCDFNKFCWARFHRHCSQFFQSPKLSESVETYYEFLLNQLKNQKYDVVLPVHEEGLFLAKHKQEFQKYAHLLVGSAETFNTILNKKLCLTKAKSLEIPVPKMTILKEVSGARGYSRDKPFYLKSQYGTSSSGVVRVASDSDYQNARNRFKDESELIAQEEIVGQQLTIQTIFIEGKIIASHQYLALSRGFGGGASHRISQNDEDVRLYAEKLGKTLNYTGPIMLDFIREQSSGNPFLIEGNPRIGETFNANLAGLNIPELLINAAMGKRPKGTLTSRNGFESHQMTTEVTGAIRRGVRLEKKYMIAFGSSFCFGDYKHSVDEFLHLFVDPISVVLAGVILIALPLISKGLLTMLDQGATKSMALNRETVERIISL